MVEFCDYQFCEYQLCDYQLYAYSGAMNSAMTKTATTKTSLAEAVLPAVDARGRALRDLRVSVTDRCNFRCGYCMPKDVFGRGYRFLAKRELLSYAEIERLVRAFARLGVQKVRLSGGEPLLRGDLEELVGRLAGVPEITDLALTTNASLLTAGRARALKEAGVRRINISLDALDEGVYRRINQIESPLGDILRGVENALAVGFESVKINMVVQKGVNVGEILPMARRFRGSGAILRFIEFMDSGNHNRWSLEQVFTAREIVEVVGGEFPLVAVAANYPGEVAKRWRYADGQGEIGVISSISQPFCGGCARARLSAVGELYTCLFARSGFDLRGWLREGGEGEGLDEGELARRIGGLWEKRRDQYSVERSLNGGGGNSRKVEMSYIGG